ncbi:MAG TPA: hypothetical protein VLH79_12450 [Chthonomonadales bacterium]|nr:hypothetical protein [Chthonomonadales bacterium]
MSGVGQSMGGEPPTGRAQLRRLRRLLRCARLLRYAYPAALGAFAVLCLASVIWAAAWFSAHPEPHETDRSAGRQVLLVSGAVLAAVLAAATALREGVRAASARVLGACDRIELADLLEASRLEDPAVAAFAREAGARRLASLDERSAEALGLRHWEAVASWLADDSRAAALVALGALREHGPPACLAAVERLATEDAHLPLAADAEVHVAATAAANAIRARATGAAASLLRAADRPPTEHLLLRPVGSRRSIESTLLRSGDGGEPE